MPSATLQAAAAGGCQASARPASRPSARNSRSSETPAARSSPSPSPGTHSSRLLARAGGTTSSSIQGTASRLAGAPLRLNGRPSASSGIASPSAIPHCARPQAAHQRQRPRRPANSQSSRATARNDSQNPACRLAQRLDQQDQHQRCQQRGQQAQVAETQAPDQRQADHQAGAPHRDLETRHQPVAPGTKQTQGACTGQPGQAPRPAAQAMQGRHQAIEHPRQQRDMRTGDDHQMHGAGVLEHSPLGRAQPRAIPSTSAARAAPRPCASTASRRWRQASRQASRPLAGCRRWPAFTVPTAPTRCANNQAS